MKLPNERPASEGIAHNPRLSYDERQCLAKTPNGKYLTGRWSAGTFYDETGAARNVVTWCYISDLSPAAIIERFVEERDKVAEKLQHKADYAYSRCEYHEDAEQQLIAKMKEQG